MNIKEINIKEINIKEKVINIKENVMTNLRIISKSWIFYFVLLMIGILVGTHFYLKSQIHIEAPKVDLGKKVVVILDNGKEMKTYENLIIRDKKKTYYENEYIKIDVSDGIVVYQDWK